MTSEQNPSAEFYTVFHEMQWNALEKVELVYDYSVNCLLQDQVWAVKLNDLHWLASISHPNVCIDAIPCAPSELIYWKYQFHQQRADEMDIKR